MVGNVSAHPVARIAPVVLCVDDDPLVLGLIRRLLERRGYCMLPASGGAEAVKIFLCNRIDLVVLDYDMPEMKGHVLATELKSLNPKIPVIMQSGSPDLPEAVTGTADAFLPKDQSLAPLLLAISTLIKSNGAAANSLSA